MHVSWVEVCGLDKDGKTGACITRPHNPHTMTRTASDAGVKARKQRKKATKDPPCLRPSPTIYSAADMAVVEDVRRRLLMSKSKRLPRAIAAGNGRWSPRCNGWRRYRQGKRAMTAHAVTQSWEGRWPIVAGRRLLLSADTDEQRSACVLLRVCCRW